MARQVIEGSDTLDAGKNKMNANFEELYEKSSTCIVNIAWVNNSGSTPPLEVNFNTGVITLKDIQFVSYLGSDRVNGSLTGSLTEYDFTMIYLELNRSSPNLLCIAFNTGAYVLDNRLKGKIVIPLALTYKGDKSVSTLQPTFPDRFIKIVK